VSVLRSEIILASASPRRRELLAEMGVPFEVVTSNVEELTEGENLGPLNIALYNARIKAAAVRKLKPGRWVLGADTVVAWRDQILGKPATIEQAHDYLRKLSGNTHEVFTGCALVSPDGGDDWETFFARSRVTFRPLSSHTISRYLSSVYVLDKAGAYALQEHGDWIIERVEGSRSNIIGLPTEVLERVFRKHGLL
jgi:septum formation protein